MQVLTAGNLQSRKTGGKGKTEPENSELVLGSQLRIVVADLDGKSGKDVVVGNADGELLSVLSYGDQLVDAYKDALQVKLDELVAVGLDASDIQASLDSGKYAQAAARVEALMEAPDLSAEVVSLLAELLELL